MRSLLFPLVAGLSVAVLPACSPEPWAALGAADLVSVVVLGRSPGDVGVSAITGRDCSVVRLDRGQTYCTPRNQPPPPEPFCTRSLGVVDCWANPEALLPAPQRPVGDSPLPNAAQDRYRRAPWPKSLTAN